MIRKLKIKFITLAMAALLTLLFAIVFGMNLINYNTVVSDADEILILLCQNKGQFPGSSKSDDKEHNNTQAKEQNDRKRSNISPELPYETRYFSVLLNPSGQVIQTETGKIAAIDSKAAEEYGKAVFLTGEELGFAGEFRYMRTTEGNTEKTRIIFLDCGRKLKTFYNFLCTSVGMAFGGYVIVFFIIFFFSGRITRPIAESYEKQKQFITDAGHELKTPLTIIHANVDLLEMELGENESLADIRQQADRLRTLTNDLVLLARMEEAENSLTKIEFPISEVVADAVCPFRALAAQQEKVLTCSIQPMLLFRGNDKAVEQLVIILMDNALKYSPSGSTVSLSMAKQGKSICLSVTNATEAALQPEQLNHVFDRFYRTDASRNSETGGHGIGLSVAKAIMTAHGGKLQVSAPDSYCFCITATFPI